MISALRPAIGVLIATWTIASCTMIPRYERPLPPVATQFPDSSAEGAATATPGAEQIIWRNFCADERLRRLIELALANNRDLRIALLNVESSRSQYRITRAASLPTLEASAGLTRDHAGGLTSSQWSASIGATAYELDLFGRVRSLNAQAVEFYLATEEGARSAQIALVAEVATQYFTLRENEEQLALARETLSADQESYRLNKATFDGGASNELDVRAAEGQMQTGKIDVLTYERQLAQATNALVLLVGAPLPADLPSPRAFDDGMMLADIPVGLPSDLVQRRPDILEAEQVLKAANANIGAARAAYFPTIRLTGALGTASPELAHLFGSGAGTWSFSPQLSLPIFNLGATAANLDVAKISARVDVATYEKTIQTAFREVADALIGGSTYARHIEEAATAVAAQQRRVQLADLRYRSGEDLYLNVLTARQDLYNAQQDRLRALFSRLSSQISLYKALGVGWR